MKKIFKIGCLGLIAIVVLIVIITVATGGDDDTTSDDKSSKKDKKVDSVGLNEELEVNKIFFTANETSKADSLGGEYGVKAQSSYFIVDIEVRNERDEAITVDSSFFKLKANGKTYDSDGGAAVYANENADFFLANVNPDVSLTGKVVFDVPEDLEDVQLQVQTGAFGTETGVINLK